MGYPSVNRLTLIIPREAIPAPDAQLPTRIWLIIRGIVHMWNIDQFDLIAWLWCANCPATGRIVGPNTGTGTTVLGHSITMVKSFNDAEIIWKVGRTLKGKKDVQRMFNSKAQTRMCLPSNTSQHNAILRKSSTSALIGADPETTIMIFPPRTART